METAPLPQPDDSTSDDREGGSSIRVSRVAVWAAVVVILAAALSLLNMRTVWYSYNLFTQRTDRKVGHHGFITVWKSQVEHLSSVSGRWLLDAAFIASIAVILVGVAAGLWLLLVSSGEHEERDPRYRVLSKRAE